MGTSGAVCPVSFRFDAKTKYLPTPRIALFVGLSVRPLPKNIASSIVKASYIVNVRCVCPMA